MKINDLEFYLVEISRTESRDPVRSLLVRLVTDSGREGWGESTLGWRPGELAARRAALLPVLAGRSVFDISELLSLEVLKDPLLRCAVEMACWDLIGRVVGQPLCNLMGGRYRTRVPMAVRLCQSAPDRVAEVGRALAEQGFYTQVVTASGRPEEDLRTLRAVRAATGERADLYFDGRACYEMESVSDLCAEMESDSPQFFIDPLAAGDLFSVAALGRQTSVPLAMWRAIRGPSDVQAAVRCGAAPMVVIDLGLVGGITPARKCAAVAEAGGLRAVLGGQPSLGIATAAMLQLAAATPILSGYGECAFHQLRDHVLADGLDFIDGMMAVPHAPGLGVEIDRLKVERYQVA
jgi:L-alanine-DL-glutamate epimerase-like enolase superfamily enzyme